MALAQRIAALQKRHEWLDQILGQEMHHLYPDEIRLHQIKKSKLRVKDEIASLANMERKVMYDDSGEMEYRQAV
ncbi:MAG: DUF465 domain-containing protein [Proteobacteria bacterium]|nr:DUF465 domain-containing protein [Pseudomonadota bacterium]